MQFAKVADVMPLHDGVHRDHSGIERHRRDGRPKIYPEGGGKGEFYTRVSTLVDALSDKSTLNDWKLRMTLKGLARRPDLMEDYARIGDPDGHDKRKALQVAEKAMDAADAGFRASAGTEVHDALESILKGEAWSLPPDIEGDAAAFVHAFKRLGLEYIDSEVFGVNDELKVGGSCDYILNWGGWDSPDAEPVVLGDIKTGRPYWGKTAMQVGIYARCKRYDPETYERRELTDGIVEYVPSTSTGLFIHVPLGEGRCDIRPLNLVQGWRDAQLAAEVREVRKRHQRKESTPQSLVNISSDGLDVA